MDGHVVAPRRRELSLLKGQLTAWLRERCSDRSDLRIENLTYPSGTGMSHETILLDSNWKKKGAAGREGLVVRVKPTANMIFPDDLFEDQYRIMQVIHRGGWLPVAEPLWIERDADVIGAPFFVMRKIAGPVPVSRPPYAVEGWIFDAKPKQRRRVWQNGVAAMAAVQNVRLSAVDFLAGPSHARSGLAQEWDKYSRFIEWVSQYQRWPVLDAARDALAARWPTNQPPGLVGRRGVGERHV